MGLFMASNLARAGFSLTVWNRTASRADDVVALGGSRTLSWRA
jgi:3-hydroxyisobutyrate dehydrogenase-like beta-hydroxyacid dehydrogenase